MKLINVIETVLKDQSNGSRKVDVDVKISNGNILLRSFHIYDIDLRNRLLKGLTSQEEYAHAREGREPVYCYLKLDEIKELIVPELDLEYSAELAMAGY
jgi:hypothetical protein